MRTPVVHFTHTQGKEPHMHKKRIFILAAVLLLTILLASGAQAMSSDNYALDWMVLMNGGGGTASSESYTASLTIGQTAVGSASGSSFSGGLGYWFGVVVEWARHWRLNIPLILRDAT
jgi:hypothetical protein